MVEERRMIWVDSLKGILILLVILGHSIQNTLGEGCYHNYWWNLIYSFHMPAFMAISGYLQFRGQAYGGRYFNRIKRRMQQLLIPFFIWTIISIFLKFTSSPREALIKTFLYPSGGYWFLWVLWVETIIMYGCQYLSYIIKMRMEWLILFVTILLIVMEAVLNTKLFALHLVSYYFIFYSFGYLYRKYEEKFVLNGFLIPLLGIVWFIMACFWNIEEVPSFLKGITFLPSILLNFSYRVITAIIGIIFLFKISMRLLNESSAFNNFIVYLGKVSLGIYVCHMIIGPYLNNAMVSFTNVSEFVNVMISFVATALITIILIRLVDKNVLCSKFLLGKV